MPEEIFKTSQPTTEPKPKNWPKIILIAVLGFGLLAGAAYAGYWYGTESSKLQEETTPTLPVEDKTKGWKIYKNEECGYEIKWPNEWIEVEHSSNFPCTGTFKAPDESSFQITVENNKFKNLDQYLEELDKNRSTGWEGLPSVNIVESKDATLGTYKTKERTEDWLAAGFTVFVTYANIGSKVFSFTVLPYGNEDFAGTDAFKKYDQILSTFKFLD